jgi:ankyrin repeat protein
MMRRTLGIAAAALLVSTTPRLAAAGELENQAFSGAASLTEAAAGFKAILAAEPGNDPATQRQKLLDEKLLSAVSTVNVAEVRRLIGMGANPNAYDGYKMTPLTQAVWDHGDLDVLGALLELGAQVDFKGTCDTTALQAAGAQGRLEAAQFLVAHHATVDAKSCVGETALVGAAANGKTDVFTYLLGLGADPNATDWEGKSTFLLAANLYVAPEHNDILAALLADKRTNVNAEDKDGMTALKTAAKSNNIGVVKLLLADPAVDVNNGDGGTTALFLAELNKYDDVAALLRAAGAKETIASR